MYGDLDAAAPGGSVLETSRSGDSQFNVILDAHTGEIVFSVLFGQTVPVAEAPAPSEPLTFNERFPGIVHDHPPLVCEEGAPGFACSEAYYHRSDLEMQAWYVTKAWIESVMQCGTQRDILHSDDRHPIGHQVFTYLDCEDSGALGPTPTSAPQD